MQRLICTLGGGKGTQFGRSWLRLAILAILLASVAEAATRTVETVAEGTRFETPCYVQETGVEGPTVMIVAGIHGDEPAGVAAAEQIRHWPMTRGKMVVIPRANVPALEAGSRTTPEVEEPLRNLNRNFQKAGQSEPARGVAAGAIWKVVEKYQPDWLVDLHEGADFHQVNSESVGSSVIAARRPEMNRAADVALEAVNATIEDEKKRFVRLGPPADGSLARAAAEHLSARAMILETTQKSQRLSKRTRQHRIMVHRLLDELDLLDPSVTVNWITDFRNPADRTVVALYDAGGAAGKGLVRIPQILADSPDTILVRVGPEEIRGGALAQFDLVIFPGGSGSKQAAALGPSGCEQVRQFVRQGGGYVGICAGAYLATSGFSWGLKILDAKTVSPKWRRGRGTVEIEPTEEGRRILGADGRVGILYVNGPILMPAEVDALPDYVPLAFFRTELAENGTPVGVMTDSPAIVAGPCGGGRVLCFSPHPEQTDGLEDFLRRAVRWVVDGR